MKSEAKLSTNGLTNPTRAIAAFSAAYERYQVDLGVMPEDVSEYPPNAKDKRAALSLKGLKQEKVEALAREFFQLILESHKNYRDAPVTFSSFVYNRGDLVIRHQQRTQETRRMSSINRDEF